ncbi:MAG TPA: SRPBCC domain-containing protein [Gaiellaceae bacterium]|jgi:uncharacterized protein YndB with AHSA1/START domain|nr:SRPBCC domain-containing protein [Gaiellaceae bacterium]
MTTTANTIETTQVYRVYIKATPEAIWAAITEPELVRQYYHECRLETAIAAGGRWRAWSPDHTKLWIDSPVLEFDPPRRLVHAWKALYDDECALEAESRVTWELEPEEGGYTKVTVVHDRLEGAPKTAERVSGEGWMFVLSGLKTLVETGTRLKPATDKEME